MDMGRARSLSSKSILLRGAVKPWHVVFLYSLGFVVSTVAAYYLTQHERAEIRHEMNDVVWRGINGVIILIFTIVVPEFRRSLPTLFAKPSSRVAGKDVALALGVCLAWGYGLYRIALCFPLIHADLERFYGMFIYTLLPDFQPKHLLMLIGISITAPLAEELIFRGYLLNLWIDRWGVTAGILASSTVFGLIHLEHTLFALPLGIVFALVYLKYDSLWPGIALHSIYNALAFPWIPGPGRFFLQKDMATADQLVSWIPELLIALAFIPLAVLFWRRFKPVTA
jgi:membrane protease YdiL (CAAX protease family)